MSSNLRIWLTLGAGGLIVLAISTILLHAGIHSVHRTATLYRSHFGRARRERLFLASVGFFLTAAFVRSLTLAIRFQIAGLHDISVRGTHVHHLVWGILILLLIGYLWLARFGTGDTHGSLWLSRATAILYGVGAALTLDEFALWLHLEDVYWTREGRQSIEVLILFGALLSTSIWGHPFFRAILRDLTGVTQHKKPKNPVAP